LSRLELCVRDKNESEHAVDLCAAVIDDNSEAPCFMVAASDKTENERIRAKYRIHREKLERTLRGTVAALAATVEIRDPYIAGHQRRVSELAMAIASELGLPPVHVEGVRVAAMLHDIGKIYVPPEVLAKRAVLSDFETRVIQAHAQAGHDLLRDIEFPWPIAAIIGQHHERLDGSGYPNGLTAERILPEARILAVADVVEAMSSERPHRQARNLVAALKEIESGSGRRYDPDAVAACLRVFNEKNFCFGMRRAPLPTISFCTREPA
jgi:putative nucleotidyltransferase with HDIG domain